MKDESQLDWITGRFRKTSRWNKLKPQAECAFHEALVARIRRCAVDDLLFFHSANGAWTGEKGGATLYRLGVCPGIPDILFERPSVLTDVQLPEDTRPWPQQWDPEFQRWHMPSVRLAMELKRSNREPLTDAQLKVKALYEKFCVPYVVCYTLEQATAILRERGFIKKECF